MSKLIPSISGAACVIWVSVWSWWLSDNRPTGPVDNGPVVSAFTITDGTQTFSSKSVFSFHLSDAAPVIPEPTMEMLKSIAVHLNEQPTKKLVLTGKYMEGERNKTPFANLGLARANAVKDFLEEEGAKPGQMVLKSELIGIHYLVEDRLLGGVDMLLVNNETQIADSPTENDKVEEAAPAKETEPSPDGILIKYDPEVFTLAKENRSLLDSLRRLVRKNPKLKLIISGYSAKKEEQTVSGNLAERRALAVRRYLVDTGVRRKNIILESHPASAQGNDQQRVEISVIE